MKSSDLFGILAAVYAAPHVSTPFAIALACVFGVLAILMRYRGKD
jgi:hypothetical protein